MEELIRTISEQQVYIRKTFGIFLLEKKTKTNPPTDNFDFTFLVVTEEHEAGWSVSHYEFKGKSAVVFTIEESRLRHRRETEMQSRLISWVMDGEIVYDQNHYSEKLKQELLSFPKEDRERRMATGFAKLIRSYGEAKGLNERKQYLDANHAIDETLHRLASLSIIEEGYRPENMLWNQVKKIDLEVYKLYEEFASNEETMDKRINLLLIGIEFAVARRAESCARHLLRIMKGEKKRWAIDELIFHPEIEDYAFDLSYMVEYLTAKGILEAIQETSAEGLIQRLYRVKGTESRVAD